MPPPRRSKWCATRSLEQPWPHRKVAANVRQWVESKDEVDPPIDELKGRTVSVAGYLPECGGYDCTLYRNKEDADEWDRFMAAVQADNRTPLPPKRPTLGIGSGTDRGPDLEPRAIRTASPPAER